MSNPLNGQISPGGGGLSQSAGGNAIGDNEIVRGDTTGIQGSNTFLHDDGDLILFQASSDSNAFQGFFNVSGGMYAVRGGEEGGANTYNCVPMNASHFGLMTVSSGSTLPAFFDASNATIDFSSNAVIRFSDTANNATATKDIGLARNAAGVLRVTNGSTGISSLLRTVLVEANTAGVGSPNILLANESKTTLTNEGSTAKNYHTLPTAVAGYEFTFIVQDVDGLRVVASAGDTIRIAGSVSAAAGFCESTTIGSTVTLVSINATEWVAKSMLGTWTVT